GAGDLLVAHVEAQSEPPAQVQHETAACHEEHPGLARLSRGADAQTYLCVRAEDPHGKGQADGSPAEVNIPVAEVAREHRTWSDNDRAEVEPITALNPQSESRLSCTGGEIDRWHEGQVEPSFILPDDARVFGPGLGRPGL